MVRAAGCEGGAAGGALLGEDMVGSVRAGTLLMGVCWNSFGPSVSPSARQPRARGQPVGVAVPSFSPTPTASAVPRDQWRAPGHGQDAGWAPAR